MKPPLAAVVLRAGVLTAAAFLALAVSGSFALAQQEDAPGSKDHPLVSRYPGSWITNYAPKEFDEYDLILGKVKPKGAERTQRLEGKVTRILYRSPEKRSVLEVYRNYETALAKAGFQTLYACRDDLCRSGSTYSENLYGMHFSEGYLTRHLVAKLSRPEGDVYVTLHISVQQGTEGFGFDYLLDVVEIKPMESGLITVDAAAMANDITRTGHVAVYGILFDFNKAEIKPASEAALREIAALLKRNPKLKLHVVGHTDNVGDLKLNMDLSRRRADAVVKALTTKHAIAAARLRADGVGPLAPVASNRTDEGRSKNRRVELVEQ